MKISCCAVDTLLNGAAYILASKSSSLAEAEDRQDAALGLLDLARAMLEELPQKESVDFLVPSLN